MMVSAAAMKKQVAALREEVLLNWWGPIIAALTDWLTFHDNYTSCSNCNSIVILCVCYSLHVLTLGTCDGYSNSSLCVFMTLFNYIENKVTLGFLWSSLNVHFSFLQDFWCRGQLCTWAESTCIYVKWAQSMGVAMMGNEIHYLWSL